MANRRIFYAVQALGVAPYGGTNYTAIHGLQTVGINTRFNLEQLFEIGQLFIYDQVEILPEVEMTAEKCLDGYPLLGHWLTYGATDGTLLGRSNVRSNVALSIFADTQPAASGTPIQQCSLSGVYLQAWNFEFPVNGPSRESVTVVGNNKTWQTAGSGVTFTFSGGFTNADAPMATEGVDHRWHFLMASGIFPLNIPGINGSGQNVVGSDGSYTVHFQNIRTGCNLGREELLELGHKAPYFRYAAFPIEVRTSLELLDVQGDTVSATETGILANGNNLTPYRIYLQTMEGTKIDLGSQNMLSSVSYGGANAGARGGNATSTFEYLTWNTFFVQHPQDPTSALAG